MDLDPEYLPRRLLTDFSIYNAEVGAGHNQLPLLLAPANRSMYWWLV